MLSYENAASAYAYGICDYNNRYAYNGGYYDYSHYAYSHYAYNGDYAYDGLCDYDGEYAYDGAYAYDGLCDYEGAYDGEYAFCDYENEDESNYNPYVGLTLQDFPKITFHTLYVPHIGDFTKEDIRDIFSKYAIAMVKDVDFVAKTDYHSYRGAYRGAYIHIDYWFFSRVAANFLNRLVSEKETRLIVNDPEYWVIRQSTAKKHTQNGRKLRVQLEEEDELPPIINMSVVDEATAYKYEMLTSNDDDSAAGLHTVLQEEDDGDVAEFLDTDAISPTDTLNIGLRHDTCDSLIMDNNNDNDDTFSEESIEDYHNTRKIYRMLSECE